MTEALATAVTAATVIGAGFLAYRELDEASNSRHLAVADRLFEELNAPKTWLPAAGSSSTCHPTRRPARRS